MKRIHEFFSVSPSTYAVLDKKGITVAVGEWSDVRAVSRNSNGGADLIIGPHMLATNVPYTIVIDEWLKRHAEPPSEIEAHHLN